MSLVRRCPLLLVPAVIALLLSATPAASAGEPVELTTAQEELKALDSKLKSSRSHRDELITQLEVVGEAYHNLVAPTEPEYAPIPEDASDEDKEALEKENEKLKDDYELAVKKFDAEKEKFQRGAEKAFLKALTVKKVKRETNQRDDVNITAAKLLGNTNPRAAKGIMKAMESKIFKAKYQVPMLLLEEAFGALGRLNEHDALAWMGEEFTHSKMSPREAVDQLIAAHKAMILFTDVEGKLRYAIVKEMVKTYSGVASTAKQTKNDPKVQAAKVFWDRIKSTTIKALQHLTENPKNDEDEVLATMGEFESWFRDHKNPKRAPWKKPKEPK